LSKFEVNGQQQSLPAEEQLADFYFRIGKKADPIALEAISARVEALGLAYAPEELAIVAALDTPDKVQQFLNTEIYYNDDHGVGAVREGTAMPPRMVLQAGRAHCFEGALFAYTVNYLHAHDPKLILLESRHDYDHNLVVFTDPLTGLWGSNAHSRYPNIGGRPARYESLHALILDYIPFYYSSYSEDPKDLSLAGHSEPIDLVAMFGTQWMATTSDVWNIYFEYVREHTKFYYLTGDPTVPHIYPLVRAIKEGWLTVGSDGRARVNTANFKLPGMDELWAAFYKTFRPEDLLPRGDALVINDRFVALTGTTPLDLQANVTELQSFLDHGYSPDFLLTSES